MFDILYGWAGEGLWGYLAVALGAATPWLEIILVIPPAVALGLDPLGVGSAALVGNFLPVVGIVVGHDAFRRRFPRRMERGDKMSRTGRHARARRIMVRYGVAGLSLLGPLITGVHLAALLALASGASGRRVIAWMGASLTVWTVGLVIASVLGVVAVTG